MSQFKPLTAIPAESDPIQELAGDEKTEIITIPQESLTLEHKGYIRPIQFSATILVKMFWMSGKYRIRTNINTAIGNMLNETNIPTNRDDYVKFVEIVKDKLFEVLTTTFKGIREFLSGIASNGTSVKSVFIDMFKNTNLDVDLSEYLEGKINNESEMNMKFKFIKAHFMALLYSVFRKFISNNGGNNYNAYLTITGIKKFSIEVFRSMWRSATQHYFEAIIKEERKELADIITFDEIFNKSREFAEAIHNAKIVKIDTTKQKYVACFMIDPSYLHIRSDGQEIVNGEVKSKPAENAQAERENKLQAARDLGCWNDNKDTYAEFEKSLDRIDRKYLNGEGVDNGGKYGKTIPVIMDKLLSDLANAVTTFDADIPYGMAKDIIERGQLAFYAWMNDEEYTFASVVSNRLTVIKRDEFKVPQKKIFDVMIPQVWKAIRKKGTLYPILVPPSMYEALHKMFNQQYSMRPTKETGMDEYSWILSEKRVPVTCLVNESGNVRVENAAPNGFLVWVYAETEEARKEIVSNKGNIEIDGDKFKLLIYNPNADYNITNYTFVRGIYIMLRKNKDGELVFKFVTRKTPKNEPAEKREIETVAAMKFVCGNIKYIITYNYRTVPLPPTQEMGNDSYKLQNEFMALSEYREKNTNARNQKLVNILWENDGGTDYLSNMLASLQRFHDSIKVEQIEVSGRMRAVSINPGHDDFTGKKDVCDAGGFFG